MQRLMRQLCVAAVAGACCTIVSACGPEQPGQPQTARERQDAALRDPFHYSPDMSRTDISGGGAGNFDKEGFGKDVNDLINP